MEEGPTKTRCDEVEVLIMLVRTELGLVVDRAAVTSVRLRTPITQLEVRTFVRNG